MWIEHKYHKNDYIQVKKDKKATCVDVEKNVWKKKESMQMYKK